MKFYIQSGTLAIIYSTNKNQWDACRQAIHECNEHDSIDEYFYVDERGYRDYMTADSKTCVIPSETILKAEGLI